MDKLLLCGEMITELRDQRQQTLRSHGIVSVRQAVEFVATEDLGLKTANDDSGWSKYLRENGTVLGEINRNAKCLADNNGKRHDSKTLAAKIVLIWRGLSSRVHSGFRV